MRSAPATGPESDSLDVKGLAYRDYVEIRDRVGAFADIGASARIGLGLSGGDQAPEVVMAAAATASYFRTLGVRALLGRTFLAEEDRTPGTHPVAVISERLWRRRFLSDPAVIGRTVRLNSTTCTVVGVLPAEFTGTDPILAPELWVPTMLWPTLHGGLAATLDAKTGTPFTVLARLRDGAHASPRQGERSPRSARASPSAIPTVTRTGVWSPNTNRPRVVVGWGESERCRSSRSNLILLLACANVAGLLLGRAEARRPEVAVRIALGANRWRLIRQLLTESALLSLAGAVAGSLLAFWLLRLVPSLIPAMPITFNLDFRLDLRVLAGTLAVALLAAPVFGLFPALLASRPDVVPLLKGAASGAARRRWRVTPRNLLVVGQIAVSLALLVSSALLARSFVNQSQIDPGFVPRPMVFSTMAPGAVGYDRVRTGDFYRRLLERLAATPGVERATMVRHLPLNNLFGGGAMAEVAIPGFETPCRRPAAAVPIQRGRDRLLRDDGHPAREGARLPARRRPERSGRHAHQPDDGPALLAGRGSDRAARDGRRPAAQRRRRATARLSGWRRMAST